MTLKKAKEWSKKIKWEKIEDRIYKQNFHLCYGGDSQDFIDFIIKRKKGMTKGWKEAILGAKGCFYDYENYYFIWVSKQEQKENIKAIYMHELFHFVMTRVPLKYNVKTEEAYAYYFEYLYEEIEKALKKLI